MITAEEFQNLNSKDENSNFRIATIDPNYTSGFAKLTFEGESTLSQKGYMFLNAYKPQPNDRVLLVKVADTFIIMDKIVNTAAGEQNTFTDLITENLTVSNTATVGGLSTTSAITAGSLDASGNIEAGSLTVTGASSLGTLTASGNVTVNGATTTVKALSVTNTLNVTGSTTLSSSLKIGGSVGFYGTNPIAKQTAYMPNSTADLAAVRQRLQELITKLDNYGLFNSSY